MKKQITFLTFFIAIIFNCNGQEPVKTNQTDTNAGKEIFVIVEEMPEFSEGEQARQKFLAQNIKYPALARENNIEGTVYASFIIEKDGSLTSFKIDKGIGYGCDEEVLRMLKLMPNWKPGKQNGKAVRVMIRMPVKFAIK